MYRILAEHAEVRERRDQLRHPPTRPRSCLARRPNELWSWDITKLLGPAKWTYFYLYVMLDVFSRYVVGWMVAHRESATLAKKLIRETCARQGIGRGQLTLHADRGTSMTSKPVAFLLADLGVTKTHSRPHVSNDNPFSEAQFKTLKYRPDFPDRFGAIQDARAFCRDFFPWYNTEHHHSGLGLLTPARRALRAWPSSASRRGRPCSTQPMRPTRNVSRAASPGRRRAPRPCRSDPRNLQRPRRLADARQLAAVSLTTRDQAVTLGTPFRPSPAWLLGGPA